MRALALAAVFAIGCGSPPSRVADGLFLADAYVPPARDAGAVVSVDRPFGVEGERPDFVLRLDDEPVVRQRLMVITDAAIYRVDGRGRVLSRQPLPTSARGAAVAVMSAAWDGVGLGVTMVYGGDALVAAGVYFALSDERGLIDFKRAQRLGAASASARAVWAAAAHRVVLLASGATGGATLSTAAISRSQSGRLIPLATGLAAGTRLGDWRARSTTGFALCTVGPHNGRDAAVVRRVVDGRITAVVDVTPARRTASGRCALASSGRSELVVFGLKPVGRTPDAGPRTVNYDRPVVQVVDPDGRARDRFELLTQTGGAIDVRGARWDGRRFVVLFNPVGLRGGRLVVSAFAEGGSPIAVDDIVPVAYEPGRISGGALVSTATDYVMAYRLSRPWDRGLLYLTRFTLR